MGSKSSKRKKKPVTLKNNPRNFGSTQSLNIPVYGSFSTNPDPNAYTRPEVTHTLTRAHSAESPIAPERRRKSQQAQKIAVPVQKKNNERVPGSQRKPNTGHAYSGSIQHSPDLSPYYCNYESKNEDDLSFKKGNIMQPNNDDLYCGGKQPSSPYSFRQTDKHICGRSACSACSASSVSSRSICASSASDFKIYRRASSGPSVVDHDTESVACYVVKVFAAGQEGRVPTNYVENITSVNVESQKYFFRLSKKEAEERLLKPEIEIGTYLLRRNEGKGAYALSLRCQNEIYELVIEHYKIRVDDKGVCYIDDDSTIKIKPFSNIMELITYYTEEPGLRCKLKTPLPQDILLDDLAVKFSDFTLEENIGAGNYGIVHAGTLHGKKQVAVKSLKDGGSMTVEEFREEAETMHKLRHPNLVSLLAICEDNGKIHIIMERMSKGALLTLLREVTDNTIKLEDLMDMAIQVAEGMCYLEEKGFVHRDLRAANVLVGDGNITKIADFGLARLLDNYYANETFYEDKKGKVFPYKWTAPEAIRKQKFTVKTDVWSFGILLYEMVTYGDEPYAAMNNAEVLDWVEKGNRLRRPSEYYCPLALYNVMLQCWLKNSNERPNFECIKENLIEIKMKG